MIKVKHEDSWKTAKDIFYKKNDIWTSITETPPMPLTEHGLRQALKEQIIANHAQPYNVEGSIITSPLFGVGDSYLDAITTVTNRIIFIPQESSSPILVLNCNDDTIISFPNTTGMRLRGSYHGSGKVFLFGQEYRADNNGWFPIYEFNFTTGEIKQIAWSPFVIRNCWLGPGGSIWGDGLPIISTTTSNVTGGLTMFIPEINSVSAIGYAAALSGGSISFNLVNSITLPPIDRMYNSNHLCICSGTVCQEQPNGRILLGSNSGMPARIANYGKYVDSIIFDNVGFSAPLGQTGTSATIARRTSPTSSTSFNFTTGATGDTTFTNANRFHRGIIGPNGRIYFSPTNHRNALEISQNTNNNTGFVCRAVNIPTTVNGYGQGAMSLNNNIYFCPLGSGNIAKLTFTGWFTPLTAEMILSTWIQQQ